MYTDMFNETKGSCPYENWSSVSRASCSNPDHFHCLKDEYGRIGWVCTEPIWVEENRCPVFNTVANKLDTIACPKSKCPPYIYRSNKVDVEYACIYTREGESSTTLAPSPNNEKNDYIAIPILVLTIIVVLVVLFGIIFYIRRRRLLLNTNRNMEMEANPDESGKLVEDEKSENLANESCHSFHQAKEILDKHNLGMMEVDANPDESRNLFKTEDDSEHKADGSNESFHQAKKILDDHNRILITGVQGAGKTYLAKCLVAELGEEGGKLGNL
uniref:Uncharacterized protein LOC111110423 isoform X3 n=1 Tax=Crassostrea virginica TaxID=6565 RepID=A0A8B8BGY7_CRAVI|nr:uncharacterized protein LOC111110423 isoform X3 [Crassostrea virginica]